MAVPDVSPESPPGLWRATLALLHRLPQGALSRAAGRLADLPIPRPLRPLLLGGFARALGIDLAEAELPLAEYPTLNRLFVRRLRPGIRSWPADARAVASPVDGVLGQLGTIRHGRLIQAKGRSYTVGALLEDDEAARDFEGGSYLTLYLSPRHYHRIHAPCAGTIPLARHVAGALLPVNAAAVAHEPDLFARNERLVCCLDASGGGSPAGSAAPARAPAASGPGRVAIIAVGAYNVGRISAAFDPGWNVPPGSAGWVTNRGGRGMRTRLYDPPVAVAAGQEIMAFHLGSTVVVLLRPGVALEASLEPGGEVRLGQVLARCPADQGAPAAGSP